MEKIWDKKFRKKLIKQPQKYAKELLKNEYNENVIYCVKISRKNKIYMVIDPLDAKLLDVAGGNINGIVSAGSAATASSLPSCVMTISTVSSAGKNKNNSY